MTKYELICYCKLMRLDKPIGTLLLLWPTLWVFWLIGDPSFYFITIFIIGVFVMRSAGCVINDLADRKLDKHIERTKNRPLANGSLSIKNAIFLFCILIFIAMLLVLMLPRLTWLFALFAALTTLLYPFMKRFTHLPQVILGIAFSWGIPMVYAATVGSFPITCWLLCFANICWIIAYDTQYAMIDRNDDIKIGIKSTAILFGQYDRHVIAGLHIATLCLFVLIAWLNQLSLLFYVGLLIVAVLFIYQQRLIKARERADCFKAFLNNNYVGFVIFIALVFNQSLQ